MAVITSVLKTGAYSSDISAQSYLPWFHLYSNQFKNNKAADGKYPFVVDQELNRYQYPY